MLVPLPSKEARDYALHIASLVPDARFEKPDGSLAGTPFEENRDALDNWYFEVAVADDGFNIILDSYEGGIDTAILFIQHLFQKFSPEEKLQFEWSFDASRSVVDAYGGGAAIVTATTSRIMTTSMFLNSESEIQNPPSEKKPLYIIMDGGIIQEVLNVPDGVDLQVIDYDVDGVDLDRITKSPLDPEQDCIQYKPS